MRYLLAVLTALLLTQTAPALAATTLVWTAEDLVVAKADLADSESRRQPAFSALIAAADMALDQRPVSVMEKEELPPSGDRHDYMSIALYAWPNPDTEDGLPYIRKDGEVSPMAHSIPDNTNKGIMQRNVETLSLAYCFTEDERYAEHAALMLRTWFIDPATRMNPNLRYAQSWPGVNDGRQYGIIDFAGFSLLPDYLILLADSPHWTDEDDTAMRGWLAEYLEWLRTSRFGVAIRNSSNNHGSWYDCQVTAIALYLGVTDLARRTCEEAKSKRIAAHIDPDGSQPHELNRTKSWDYSIYNLRALVRLAQLAEHTGTRSKPPIDLWGFESDEGASLTAAIDFLLPYSAAPETWPHKQIKEIHLGGFAEILRMAALATGEQRYIDAARELDVGLADSDRRWLLYPQF